MNKVVKHEYTKYNELSEEELEYYSRQIVMTGMGFNDQLKLKNSKVCLVGVGGLGSPASMQLTAMGVGHVRIVDRDIVELTNLHRQHLYSVDDVGYPKVEVAAKRLQRLNPYIKIEPLPLSVNELNSETILKDMDIVIDGLDSMKARYAINRASVKLGVPYIFGAAITTTGNLSTLIPGETACLECFYGNLDDKKLPKCGVVGIHPSLVNVIASLEVSEAIRILTGKKPRLKNKLLHFDLDEMEINEITLSSVDSCPVCGRNPFDSPIPLKHEIVEEICGRKGKKVFVIVPKETFDVDLVKLKSYLKKRRFIVTIEASLGLTFKLKNIHASILKSGLVIIGGIKERNKALNLFREFKKGYTKKD